ncbi:hypothetical protein NEOLEDRAFT_318219 [Neolentinus lepideus HHB14362 ss-1]|uniref:AB hydrolase-1 domain-containing protein n=1 Tax=Neolentinus lepideus HHB14362 ss-1 TaxID=1314782 RepID=A0A165VUK0_9AGAM|nr:hypothetical protein NEOLEDRAFT_318219 [Neolentinus lepideus HHB14362 ss-1]
MSGSSKLIQPLTCSTFSLAPELSGSPLHVVAKCYLDLNNPVSPTDTSAITLLFAHGIGLSTELWLPTIKKLYSIDSETPKAVRIRSIWAVDSPNHGDAGVLNETVLKENHPTEFSLKEYGGGLHTFLSSGFLSPVEASSLVGVGHSGGGGALAVCAALASAAGQSPPFKSLIFVDSPLMNDRSAKPAYEELVKALVSIAMSKPTYWPSTTEAMEYLSARSPYNNFHPDVMHVLEETHFKPVTSPSGELGISFKTSNEQECASWRATDDAFAATELFYPMLKMIPSHYIIASRGEIWPPPVLEVLKRTFKSHRSELESAVYIDATHYIPQEKPYELAYAIMSVLQVPGE